ncbi:phage major capsid protein [Pseudoxanthomonas winnipegensis]|uniref:phage major capsid protein n=1 Tax=Pseudoxanthomonas winnipegensis TaxID=2480810 RepID=UPI0013EE427B|nr:phage major capsid protein [Pseudoxanthomonas winnipegensis]
MSAARPALSPAYGTTTADIIGESLMVQANNGYSPSLVIMSPFDWFKLQITRKNATDEEYVFGSPTSPLPPSLWNTRVVTPAGMPGGTALTIDTSFVNVLERWSLVVQISNSHADFFIRNLVAILGEVRAGLEVLDTAAVQKVTLPTT